MTQNNKSSVTENMGDGISLSRRNLLKQAGCVSATVLGVGAGGAASTVLAQGTASPRQERIPVREAFETLTARESEILDALVSRILPSDENGPGAHEARVVHYIDRILAGPAGNLRELYASAIEAVEAYSGSHGGGSFTALDEDGQDAVLVAMEAGDMEGFPGSSAAFFNLVRTHTIEGAFSDPYYGGNRDFIGWDLLGYPGVRMGSSPADVQMGEDLPPSRQSAYDMAPYTKDPVSRPAAN